MTMKYMRLAAAAMLKQVQLEYFDMTVPNEMILKCHKNRTQRIHHRFDEVASIFAGKQVFKIKRKYGRQRMTDGKYTAKQWSVCEESYHL